MGTVDEQLHTVQKKDVETMHVSLGDTMMRRRIKGLNSVDRNEQARKGEVEVRISG